MTVTRKALAFMAAAAVVALAGCREETATTARSIQPISPQLVSLMTEKGMDRSDPMLLRIFKEESKAEVWKKRRSDGRYALLKSYDICRFSGKLGPKIKEGDKQAPEGFYSVTPAQMNPKSNYYLSFNIGYPNAYDRSLGRTGLHVMMHGDCLSAGCYAMTDSQIGEIYALARESFAGGQKAFQVQALPFRMTAQNIARRRDDKNIAFWKNLKQGSDNFEVTKAEPKVDACGKKYVFNATTGPLSTFEPTMGCPSYQVQPDIARAVAVKEKTDNILIAQLSKSEPPAPEYVAQNGRMRRTLDQPIIAVAAAQPSMPGMPASDPVTVAAVAAPSEPVLASVGPAKPMLAPVAPARPVLVAKAAQQPMTTVALSTPATVEEASTTKVEGNFLSRMFGGADEPAAQPQATPAVVQVASARTAAPVLPQKPGARQVATDQTPVMASSIAPAPAASDAKPAGSGWFKTLFGGAEAAQPAPAPSAEVLPAPTAPAVKKNRQAALPDQFRTARPDARVSSAFAAAE